MDEENINTSFINLFDCDGWIITKNGKGKIQAAFCEQDETNIYEKTRHWKIQQTDHTKTDSFNLPLSEIGKTARFFLRDILDSDKKDNYFICYDIPYVNVFVCGTVISFFERYRKYSVIIDDGTSSIKCIVQKEILNFKKEFCSSDTNDHHFAEIFKEDKDNTFLQAASITRQATRNLISQVPTFEELELGDFVKVFGSLGEYRGNRYIFVKQIRKELDNSTCHVTYLEDMLDLYKKMYKVQY